MEIEKKGQKERKTNRIEGLIEVAKIGSTEIIVDENRQKIAKRKEIKKRKVS